MSLIRICSPLSLCAALLLACRSEPGGSGDADASASSSGGPGSAGTDVESSGNPTLSGASEADTSGATTSSAGSSSSTDDPASSSEGDDASTGDVVEPGIYVHGTDGLNSNPGTPEAPVRTIQHALELAIEQAVPNVYVAAGAYTSSIPDEQAIDLPGGISLLGGFASDDWTVRDPLAHPTTITGNGGYVVGITGGERDDTQLDGFVLVGSSAGPVVLVDGSPTIRRNVITGPEVGDAPVGIDVAGGAPRISRNRIAVRGGGNVRFVGAVGIRLFGDGGLVDANMIHARSVGFGADAVATAIQIGNEGPVQIHGNSVAAMGSPSFAIAGGLSDAEIVGNNLISAMNMNFTGCIDSGFSYPAALTHNNFDCPAFYTVPGQLPVQTVAALNDLPGADENVAVPLDYVELLEADLHIVGTDALLCEIAVGGADLGAPVDRDYDDVPRTAPWTIGAHEVDTPCV